MKHQEILSTTKDTEKFTLSETIIIALTIAFFIHIRDDIARGLNFNMEGHLQNNCGEICTKTKNQINTIIEYQEPGTIIERKETEILSNQGPLILTNKIFPHGCDRNIVLEQTRHEYAFSRAGKFLGEESLQTGQENFKFSYPGIGSHVAFITLLKEMVNANPNIKSIDVYTPELIEGYGIIDAFLIYLEEIKYLTSYQFEKFELEDTIEAFFKFDLDQTEINIHYQVDENREKFIYPDETDFDLIILHDVGMAATEYFMQDLNDAITRKTRLLGTTQAANTQGINSEAIYNVNGAFICEHTCQNKINLSFPKVGSTFSAVLFEVKPQK